MTAPTTRPTCSAPGGTSTSGERRRWSTFAEVSIPLLKGWDLTLAGRRDDHDDVGETFSGQVARPVPAEPKHHAPRVPGARAPGCLASVFSTYATRSTIHSFATGGCSSAISVIATGNRDYALDATGHYM